MSFQPLLQVETNSTSELPLPAIEASKSLFIASIFSYWASESSKYALSLAEFTVKASNKATTELNELEFTITGSWSAEAFNKNDIDISSVDIDDCDYAAGKVTCKDMRVSLPETVTISFNAKKAWEYTLTLDSVNGKKQSRKFSKRFERALVYVKSQENKWDETTFYLWVNAENDVTVSNAVLTYSGGTVWTNEEFSDGEDVSTTNSSDGAQYITQIDYDWYVDAETSWHVSISKSVYNDYFKVGSDYAKVFKAKD